MNIFDMPFWAVNAFPTKAVENGGWSSEKIGKSCHGNARLVADGRPGESETEAGTKRTCVRKKVRDLREKPGEVQCQARGEEGGPVIERSAARLPRPDKVAQRSG
jgi:hypothetical protein